MSNTPEEWARAIADNLTYRLDVRCDADDKAMIADVIRYALSEQDEFARSMCTENILLRQKNSELQERLKNLESQIEQYELYAGDRRQNDV